MRTIRSLLWIGSGRGLTRSGMTEAPELDVTWVPNLDEALMLPSVRFDALLAELDDPQALELAKRVEGTEEDGPPRHFFESVNATAVRLLDGDGRARMGFAAASGEVGHEQYEVSRWEFERISLEKPLPNVHVS